MGPEPAGWPDSLDSVITLAFLALVVLLPAAGYLLMAADIGAYLRSLRRQLVVVMRLGQETPWWAQRDPAGCLGTFGLNQPFTEEELMRAYREQVKRLHPDRGGDRKKFLRLQADFEQALKLVASGQAKRK